MFSHVVDTAHECDRRIDGQTDGRTESITTAFMHADAVERQTYHNLH